VSSTWRGDGSRAAASATRASGIAFRVRGCALPSANRANLLYWQRIPQITISSNIACATFTAQNGALAAKQHRGQQQGDGKPSLKHRIWLALQCAPPLLAASLAGDGDGGGVANIFITSRVARRQTAITRMRQSVAHGHGKSAKAKKKKSNESVSVAKTSAVEPYR